MKKEIRESIIAAAKNYNTDEYNLFEAEYGWQEWMNDYTEASDDEECTEAEINAINRILADCFSEAHKDN